VATFLNTTQIPIGGAMTLPRRFYTSDEVFREEEERIFRDRWLIACREEEIPAAGDFVLLDIVGESVIVVRAKDGAVYAHYNTCRHRGTKMCEDSKGNFGNAIQCPYHSWSYALDGRCIGAPHMTGLEGFDKRDFPLHGVRTATWEGFVFINLSPNPEPFAQAWAPLIGRFTRFNLSSLRAAKRRDYEVAANWKFIYINYSECYHCSPVHPALVRITPAQTGENDLVEGPFLGGYMVIKDEGGSLTMSGRACGLPVSDTLPTEDHQRVYYYSIFPNMLLSLHPDYVMVHKLFPRSPNHTSITCEWFFNPESFRDPRFDAEDAASFWDLTNRQDWHVCELSQKGVQSRAYTPGPFSPRESISVAWDREYVRIMGE
jgi:Rieske 2Fe-2S family protein